MQYMTIVSKQGPRYPDGHSTIYQLRAGRKGTGKLLAQHEARGSYRAHDQARDGLRTVATVSGIASRYALLEEDQNAAKQ